MEVLHTVVLGGCKYVLDNLMSALSAKQKEEVLARVRAFNTSGFKVKMYGNVCRHCKSFVGRDFKGWAQMALFIMAPFLNDGQKQVLLTLSKVSIIIHVRVKRIYVSICMHQVFQIAYCEFFAMSLYEEWSKICVAFVEAIKMHMPELLQKQKTHLILHLVDCMRELGPSSAFSAERYIHLKNLHCGLH